MRNISLCTLTALLLTLFSSGAIAAESEPQKAVLVTGANSGIGRNIAYRLAAEGYFVYAGARSKDDIKELSSIRNMQGVRLDVTVQSDIDSAVERVKADGRGLYAVVNNAGVVVVGLLAETDESELDFLFDVNVYGPYRMVKAFAPLLIESKGRVVNISSMAGIMSPPAYGVYSMSKHAIEAFTDTLAYELGTVGVGVSAIEPGPFNSNAAASVCERRLKQDHDASQSLMPALAAELDEICNATAKYPEPDAVADVVLQVLRSDKPKARYLAPSDPQQAEFIARNIVQQLAELRSGHYYSFSREELIDMLDDALTAE
ncbi:MAG: SDR family NAD(P)-dependent oxidoreductase [Proteobacteria bacterium]|nr:SDR family NAD(P)-dependent oxidoreductase [Pseudomonadota bacterium]MDA0994806.1 SDR family NAD(P)-dependent oxidoreductase [Pseudomonadota bacterium]